MASDRTEIYKLVSRPVNEGALFGVVGLVMTQTLLTADRQECVIFLTISKTRHVSGSLVAVPSRSTFAASLVSGTSIASIHQTRMRDPDTSGLDSHSSGSEEESFEHHENLGDQLGDFLGRQTSLDGFSLPEKKLVPTDPDDLGRALFLEDKEKRFKRLYGARHVQG